MVIQHNTSAMNAAGQAVVNSENNAISAKKLSSGYKINIAADDAAGLSISEKMRWQIRGLMRGSDNAQDGISLIEVGDGALQEVHDILQRINELAIQAANDTYTDAARDMIQKEINELKEEINNIGNDTEFNTIKIFKPTNIPSVTGNPTDMLVFHEDYNNTVREGGIIYNGIRYDYDSMPLQYDANDNIVAGTYQVDVLNEKGDIIQIDLLFDGGSRVPSGRIYELKPDKNDGISIDGIVYPWNTITDTAGKALDPSNITQGRFSFQHAGMTISFSTEDGMDIDSLVNRLKTTGLTSYTIKSSNVTTVKQPVNPSVSSNPNPLTVTKAIQNLIPGNTGSNESYFQMHADNTGIWMTVPASQSHGQGGITLTFKSWADLGITDEDFMQTSMPNNSGLNPDSTVTGGEASKTYTYKDDDATSPPNGYCTGLEISFTIDSEVSKQELIASINAWQIKVNTNNKMEFKVTGDRDITAGSHSAAFDAYGTQYQMGRDMEQQMILQPGMNIDYTGHPNGTLSFTMQDANGTQYLMEAKNAQTLAEASVKNALSRYINYYANQYARRLNGMGGSLGSYTDKATVKFTEASKSNYTMEMECKLYGADFSGWVSDSDFIATPNRDKYGNITSYSVSLKSSQSSILARNQSNMEALATKVVDKMDAAAIEVATNNPPITDTNTIKAPYGVYNKRYFSLRKIDNFQMNIQVGARAGESIGIDLPEVDSTVLGLAGMDVSSHASAGAAITAVNKAISMVSEMRSGLGATQNRLRNASAVDDVTAENTQASESRIRDADMAEEMVQYSKHNILLQASQAMLAQANQTVEGVLTLLQ